VTQASHRGSNWKFQGTALLLALAVAALGLTLAGQAGADSAKTTLEMTITSQVTGYPYSFRVSATGGDQGVLTVTLSRRGNGAELHDYHFSGSAVTLTAKSSLSRGTLDTNKALGGFGKFDLVFKPTAAAETTDLKCDDGKTVYGTQTERSGTVSGSLTFNADTKGSKYFGRLSNQGSRAVLPVKPDAVLTKITITQSCPRPTPTASHTPSPRPSGTPSPSPSAAIGRAPSAPAATSACQHNLTLATTEGRSLRVSLVSGSSGSTLTLTYVEKKSKTAPATVSHALMIPVSSKQHPFTATFSSDGTKAHLKAKIGMPDASGTGSFSGPAATSSTQGSCETKTSDGKFTGHDLRLHYDSVSSGKRTVAFSKKVSATVTQTGDA
jgi:hypothetical protein